MGTGSIGTLIEDRHISRDQFFLSACEMSIAELDSIRDVQNRTQQWRRLTKTLENSGKLFSFGIVLKPMGVDPG